MQFDRTKYYDSIRESLFVSMNQQQVDGQNFILSAWETYVPNDDPRWLAYFLATTFHETSQSMWPIEEYGKGSGQPYGQPDPETGQAYYGRGFVQLTWKENYQRGNDELDLNGSDDDLVWNPERALDGVIAARVGYAGMMEGWFRGDKFDDYFNNTTDDAFEAREIINGDKNSVPPWSNGVSIGNLIKGYYENFLAALNASATDSDHAHDHHGGHVDMSINVSSGVVISIFINGVPIVKSYQSS